MNTIVPIFTALWPARVTGALRRHVARLIRRDIRRGLVVATVPSRCSLLVHRPGTIPAGVTLAEVVPMVGAPGRLAVRYLATWAPEAGRGVPEETWSPADGGEDK